MTTTTTNKKEILDSTLVPIWNIGIGDVGYTANTGSGSVRRTWRTSNSMQEIEFKELRAVFNEPGVRQLFEVFNKELGRYEDAELLIKNELVREKLDLKSIGKYTLEKEAILDLFENGSLTKFEEVLENCPNATLDRIVMEAIELPLSDINKINLIKSYSGKDILMAIQNNSKPVTETTRKVTEDVKVNTGIRSKK